MINFQIVGLEAWGSVATRSEHKNLKQTTRYKLRGSWWFAILGWFSHRSSQLDLLISLWVSPFVKPKGITNQKF